MDERGWRRRDVGAGMSLEVGSALGGMQSGGQRGWGVQDVLPFPSLECGER